MLHYPFDFDQTFRILSTAGALVTFVWTVYTWRDKARKELAALAIDAEKMRHARRLEATRPFLERQLRLYLDAAKNAAIIATSRNPVELEHAQTRFWQLYWGELALVENREVEAAMVRMGRVLQSSAGDKDGLQECSLQLARACRISLDKSWGINAWTNPDHALEAP